MAVGAQEHAHLVLGFHQVRLVDGPGDHANAVATAVGLEVGLDGDQDEVVLGFSEDASQCLGDAHDLVRIAFDGDGLAERVLGFEEARADVVADEGYGRVAAHFLVGDAAAVIHLHVVDGENVVGDAIDLDALDGISLE